MIAHYRLVEKLGEGGMGVVYKALDTTLNRHVALKLLPAHLTADPERRLRFQREAQATAALQHPNVAVVYEVGDHEGTPFLAMEYVVGRSLRVVLEQGRMDTRDWLRVAIPMADGVAHAHAHGVVHRDLKPDNVLITSDHQVKILDFGLAKLLDLDQLPEGSDHSVHTQLNTMSGELTRAGQVFGTAAYMSPEQARGAPIDHRSDIFSLGVVLYECASGTRPFRGTSHIETLHGILHDDPPPLSTVSMELPAEAERVVRKCLEKEPEHRYQHADELATDLRTLRRDLDSGRTTGPRAIPASTAPRRSPPWLVPAAVLGVALVLVSALVWFAQRGRRQSVPPTGASVGAAAQTDAAIAVVGFENLQDASDSDHLGRMLMALVTTDLAESGGLSVVSMPKVLAARQRVAPGEPFTANIAAETAQVAEASLMLVGQVGRVGQRLLLTSELIDVSSGRTLGSVQKTADSVDDLFAAAGHIGADVRKRLGQASAAPDFDLARSLTESGEAYRAFAAGEIALHQMSFADAVSQFNRAVRMDSSFALAYYKRAVALEWAGRSDEAVTSLNTGLRYVDRLPEQWREIFEGYRHYAANETETAVEKLTALLAEKPEIPDPYYTMGEILTHDSAYEDLHRARKMFERALEIDPAYRVVLFHLVETYVLADELRQGRELVERMLKLHPDDPGVREAEAAILAGEGRVDEAIETCERIVARGSDFVKLRLCYLYLGTGRLQEAVQTANDDLEQHLKMGLEQGDALGLRMATRGLMRIGTGAVRAGIDDQRAGAAMMGKGNLAGLAARAHEITGQLLWLAGDRAGARRALDIAVATDSLWLRAYHMQVRLALESGEHDEAERILSHIESMETRHSTPTLGINARLVRAEIAMGSGNIEAAQRALNSLQDFPRENLPFSRITDVQARLHVATGDYEAAARSYRDLIDDAARIPFIIPSQWIPGLFELARVEEKLGNEATARRLYERFLTHWGNADMAFPSVAEARARLAALRETP